MCFGGQKKKLVYIQMCMWKLARCHWYFVHVMLMVGSTEGHETTDYQAHERLTPVPSTSSMYVCSSINVPVC